MQSTIKQFFNKDVSGVTSSTTASGEKEDENENEREQKLQVKKKQDNIATKPSDKLPHKRVWSDHVSPVVEVINGVSKTLDGVLMCKWCHYKIQASRGKKGGIQWQSVTSHFKNNHHESAAAVILEFKEKEAQSSATVLEKQIAENIETFQAVAACQSESMASLREYFSEINPDLSLHPIRDSRFTTKEKNIVNLAWAATIVLSEAPLRFSEGPFAQFFEFLCGYKPPSRATTRKLILEMWENHKNKLKKTLKLVRDSSPLSLISLVTDVWKAKDNESYMGVSVTYACPWDFEVQTELIGLVVLTESHSGAYLASKILELLKEYGICDADDTDASTRIFSACTDNAAAALKSSEALGVLRIGCTSHAIQLALTDALNCNIPDPNLAVNGVVDMDTA